MLICNTKEVEIHFNKDPLMDYRPECKRPFFDFITMKWKPFVNLRTLIVTVIDKVELVQYTITIEKGYRWNGSNIPFGTRWIVGSPKDASFKVASAIHDKICENHSLVGGNRKLSSTVYNEVLKYYYVNPVNANIQEFFVDNFQKVAGGW